jgi:hypothetical protein
MMLLICPAHSSFAHFVHFVHFGLFGFLSLEANVINFARWVQKERIGAKQSGPRARPRARPRDRLLSGRNHELDVHRRRLCGGGLFCMYVFFFVFLLAECGHFVAARCGCGLRLCIARVRQVRAVQLIKPWFNRRSTVDVLWIDVQC